jgi:pimeloyl-ACP methyl ester carboxylesterase
MTSLNRTTTKARGYAPVNGLDMYYEIEGAGHPLRYIPPAFGYAGLKSFPELIQSHTVITVDLLGHGRIADIPDRPITFERHAKDVAGLLKSNAGPEHRPGSVMETNSRTSPHVYRLPAEIITKSRS